MTADGAPHVIIVERDVDIRAILRDLLMDVGYQVTACATPPPASTVATMHPSVIVLDVAGGRDGDDPASLAFLHEFASTSAENDIPPVVVCLGGWDLTVKRRKEVAQRASAVITKPFSIERFIQCVDECARTAPRRGQPSHTNRDSGQ